MMSETFTKPLDRARLRGRAWGHNSLIPVEKLKAKKLYEAQDTDSMRIGTLKTETIRLHYRNKKAKD